MATKNISRSAIEGGRAGYSKNSRWFSNERLRAQNKQFCHHARFEIIDVEEDVVSAPIPVRRPVRKEFTDKLNPAYRWLRSNVGKKWDEVFSKLTMLFDTRNLASRHVVYDHMYPDVDQTGERLLKDYDRTDFYVDEEGILRISDNSRHFGARQRREDSVSKRNMLKWANHRRVMHYPGDVLFWMNPTKLEKRVCHAPETHRNTAYFQHHSCPFDHAEGIEKIYIRHDVDGRSAPFYLKETDAEGNTRYYYLFRRRYCLQSTGTFRQGLRFTARDIEMWNKLSEHQRNDLIWCIPKTKSAKKLQKKMR